MDGSGEKIFRKLVSGEISGKKKGFDAIEKCLRNVISKIDLN